MEHHASNLSQWLTEVLGLQRHAWPYNFGHGAQLSILERYDHLLNAVLAFLLAVILTSIVRARMKQVPGPLQQVFEFVVDGLDSMVKDNIQHHPEKFLPFVGTMALFVFFNNFFGLIPGLSPATSNWNVTLGCALVVFAYYNFHGMKEQGFFKYWAHFAGPIWWLAPLLFPLELLGLTGNIVPSENDDLDCHLHIMAGKSSGDVVGGHLYDSEVFATCEIVLTELVVEGIERHLSKSGGTPTIFFAEE